MSAPSLGKVRRGWAHPVVPPAILQVYSHLYACVIDWRNKELLNLASHRQLARGVIGNTPGFDPGIPSSSLGGPVPFKGIRDE